MPFEVALIIAGAILATTIVAMTMIYSLRTLAAREEELKQAASARGWQFESKLEKGYRVHRWSGSTEGVSWVAESLMQAAGSHSRSKRRWHVARWHGNWSPGINSAIVAMGLPKGKEQLETTVAAGESWVAKLAQKAVGFALDKSIDVYFGEGPGKEVDAGAMHRIETKTPGFVVMAADKDEGARVLRQGLEKALVDAASDKASVLSNEQRPWILLRPNAVSLARMERFRDVNELDGFVRAGVSLTRVFKFGRGLT